MALFQTRKKSSSPSYVSTLTILVFIALCVFGVWMLTSNSVVPPQTQSDEDTSTRTAIDTSATTNDELSSSEDSHETTSKSGEKEKDNPTAVYGDNSQRNALPCRQEESRSTTQLPAHPPIC